jgi:hypothetical protein
MLLARMSSYSADKGCGCSSTGEDGGDVNHVGMSVPEKDQVNSVKR